MVYISIFNMKGKGPRLFLLILCVYWIFYFLLTVKVHIFNGIQQFNLTRVTFNKTAFWKNIFQDVNKTNLSRPSQSSTFQNKSNNATQKKRFDWFNSTLLPQSETGRDIQSHATLYLRRDLVGFQNFYNQHGGIGGGVLKYGKIKQTQVLLTIGIPTMKRPFNDHFYLNVTLKSLVTNIAEEDRDDTVIVIFMTDTNTSWVNRTADEIYRDYKPHFDKGLIQIITAPQNIYPNFTKLKKTKHDSVERVRWRSKQNIDFAFLMLYCRNISAFYLQLEDDVLAAHNFITDMTQFVQKTTNPWVCLEFSALGFIGKLFHFKNVYTIAKYFLTNFDALPCDVLLGKIRVEMGQKRAIHSRTSLFQHIGKISSLKNKMMPSIDRRFKSFGSKNIPVMMTPKGDNPPAKFETNMRMIGDFSPENVYINTSYFWASNIRERQYFKVTFEKPWNISRIIISTGDNLHNKDFLLSGVLKVGAGERKNYFCNNLRHIGNFVEGEIDSLIQGFVFPRNVDCLHIEVRKRQVQWLIIREITVVVE